MYGIGKVFQANINLDYMSEEEIRKAIIVRHGATHKVLVNDEEERIDPKIFTQMIRRINQKAESNIGRALNLWSYATKHVNDNMVIHESTYEHELPDFINEENGILLRSIVMSKKTHEYQLRKNLGPSFQTKYQRLIQRLINLGVLMRSIDGQLEVNEALVAEVSDFLAKSKYIQIQ